MSVIITETQTFCVIVRRHTLWTCAVAKNGSYILHYSVGKKLLSCPQMGLSYRLKNCVSDYHTGRKVLCYCYKTHSLDISSTSKWKISSSHHCRLG